MIRPFVKMLTGLAGLSLAFAVNAQPVAGLFHHNGDPIGGNASGSVTVVEFFDYQCSHCVKMAPVMSEIIKANPDVRVVYKDYPIRGPESELAARAAIAANLQGKYTVFSHALLNSSQDLNENSILDIAKSVGLNVDKLKRDMKGKKVTDELKNTLQIAQQFNLTATPAFFIGKTSATNSDQVNFVLGEMSQSELQSAIEKASK